MAEINTETVRPDPTLRDLLAPLFRRKKIVIFIFCGVLLGTVVAAFLFTNGHQASLEILVETDRVDPVLSPQSTQSAAPAHDVSDTLVNGEIELLKSTDLLEKVAKANRLDRIERKSWINLITYGRHDDPWYLAAAVKHLRAQLTIKQVAKTSMIGITYTSGNPKIALNVLQTLANGYLEKHLIVHRPPGSYDFFSAEAEKYRQALLQSEARLSDFSTRAQDASPGLQKVAMAPHVVEAIASLQEVRQHIAADKERIQDQEARLKITPERSLAAKMSDSAQSLMQKLQGDLVERQVKRSELTFKYDPSYPLVQEQDREIVQTQAAIADSDKLRYVNETTDRDPTHEMIREDIAKTQADLASHQATAAAIENTIRSLQAQMVDLEQRSLQEADVAREVQMNETNYLLYVGKREQERTTDALDQKRISNVSIAVPPVLPLLPTVSPALVMLVGIAAAIFLSTATAFVLEYLNPSLRTPSEVIEVLRIPVLASVPKQTA